MQKAVNPELNISPISVPTLRAATFQKFESGFFLFQRGDTMVYLAFIDMMIATFLVYAVWSTIDEARGCFDEYNLFYRGKLRNGVMTVEFYIRMFIVGLIPIINLLMVYLYTYERTERLEEWIDIIQLQFTLESR